MNRAFFFSTLTLIALTYASTSHAASITYDLVNYPALQNGYTLSGTITTDGTIGTLTSSNILAWQYTAANGVSTFHAASVDPGTLTVIFGAIATPTQIMMPPPIFPNDVVITLAESSSSNFALLTYTRPGVNDFYNLRAPDNGTDAWLAAASFPPGLSLGGSTWVVATAVAVPEPCGLALMGLGLAGVIGLAWRRRLA
jgi:hypothetical protein